MPQKIWIDTDIAMGASKGDVDDGFALAAIFCAAKKHPSLVEMTGVSVVDGNTTAQTAAVCAEKLCLKFAMPARPLVTGNSAGSAIANLPAKTIILALGPLTNIAAAFEKNPALAGQTSVYWVGGVSRPWSVRRRLSDLNVRRNPQAAALVQAASQHARQFPLDVIDRLTADAAQLKRIAATGEAGRYLAESSQRWLRYAWLRHGYQRFPVWDLVPALYAIGKCPEAVFDDKNRLIDFNAKAAWREFERLLAGC